MPELKGKIVADMCRLAVQNLEEDEQRFDSEELKVRVVRLFRRASLFPKIDAAIRDIDAAIPDIEEQLVNARHNREQLVERKKALRREREKAARTLEQLTKLTTEVVRACSE